MMLFWVTFRWIAKPYYDVTSTFQSLRETSPEKWQKKKNTKNKHLQVTSRTHRQRPPPAQTARPIRFLSRRTRPPPADTETTFITGSSWVLNMLIVSFFLACVWWFCQTMVRSLNEIIVSAVQWPVNKNKVLHMKVKMHLIQSFKYQTVECGSTPS